MSDQPEIQIRPVVMWFAEAMERKLRANDHKGGWQDCATQYLWRRLGEEKRELDVEVHRKTIDSEKLLSEAADVANIAMMLADQHMPWERAAREQPDDPEASIAAGVLRNLLARAHGDGGQRQIAEKIPDDGLAMALNAAIVELQAERDALRKSVRDPPYPATPPVRDPFTARELDQIESDFRAGLFATAGVRIVKILRTLVGVDR